MWEMWIFESVIFKSLKASPRQQNHTKTAAINCESMWAQCGFSYKSCLLLRGLVRQKPGVQRQRTLRPTSYLPHNGIFAAEHSIQSPGGQEYTGEGSGMGGSPYRKERITRSPLRHLNRSSVLTGECGRAKIKISEMESCTMSSRDAYWYFSTGYEGIGTQYLGFLASYL